MALDDVDEKFKLTLSEFVGLLLELLDGTLVDSSALEDQVTGGGGLAGIWAKGDLSVPARGGGERDSPTWPMTTTLTWSFSFPIVCRRRKRRGERRGGGGRGGRGKKKKVKEGFESSASSSKAKRVGTGTTKGRVPGVPCLDPPGLVVRQTEAPGACNLEKGRVCPGLGDDARRGATPARRRRH